VKDTRPVNLDISTIKLPITAYTSILHRISGVFLVGAVGLMIYALDLSLDSADGFAAVAAVLQNPMVKFVAWVVASGLIYHSVAGIKHLIMDLGYGESWEGGVLGSKITFAVSFLLIAAMGFKLW
jgi:succinate dehydrogenase / fumarate reductase, cytochrome b subunit